MFVLSFNFFFFSSKNNSHRELSFFSCQTNVGDDVVVVAVVGADIVISIFLQKQRQTNIT